MGKCEICGKDTKHDVYRCDDCNIAWQIGYDQGYDNATANIREKLRDILGIR